MYVDDLLLAIQRQQRLHPFIELRHDPWYQQFIDSISMQVILRRSLSTGQSHVILRMIRLLRPALVHRGMATTDDIDSMLQQPQFRHPLYETRTVPREVRHLGDNLLGFRFKQQDQIVARIKQLNPQRLLPKPTFDWDYRLWVVPVLRCNLHDIDLLINEYRFHVDPPTANYLRGARHGRDQPTVLTLTDQAVLLARVSDDALLAGWIVAIGDGIAL